MSSSLALIKPYPHYLNPNILYHRILGSKNSEYSINLGLTEKLRPLRLFIQRLVTAVSVETLEAIKQTWLRQILAFSIA